MSSIEYDINLVGYVEDEILKRYKSVVFETWNRLSVYTPVLTGKAKGNWQTRIGGDNDDVLDRVSNQGLSVQDMGGSQAEVIRVLAALSIKDTVVIFNNVPYIERIEYGWPAKHKPPHPGYFVVTRTINDIEAKFK